MRKGVVFVSLGALLALAGGLVALFGPGAPANRTGSEPPAIEVVAEDGTALPAVVAQNQWHGSVADRLPIWDIYTQKYDPAAAPVVPLGSVISIKFPSPVPTGLELRDQVYVGDGTSPLGPPVETTLTTADGSAEFSLCVNYAAAFSSDSTDYEPGGIVRGYILVATWRGGPPYGDDSAEYAFALRTDAFGDGEEVPTCE